MSNPIDYVSNQMGQMSLNGNPPPPQYQGYPPNQPNQPYQGYPQPPVYNNPYPSNPAPMDPNQYSGYGQPNVPPYVPPTSNMPPNMPPTSVPPTVPPTNVPPTNVPPTNVPPYGNVPPTQPYTNNPPYTGAPNMPPPSNPPYGQGAPMPSYGQVPSYPNAPYTSQTGPSYPSYTDPKQTYGMQGVRQIDPGQIPHPVTSHSPKVVIHSTVRGNLSNPVPTTPGIKLPFATQRTMVLDEGTCSSRFMRATMQTIPLNATEWKNLGLPFGVVMRPLADVKPYDRPNFVPAVDFGEEGPVRCNRCHAYINPYVTFVDNGKNYLCNLCGFQNSVPNWYVCGLDGNGKRIDLANRPELLYGSVDFVANKSFYNLDPLPMTFVILLDVSVQATQQGIVSTVVHGLKELIPELAKTHANVKLAIVTYSRVVHFYNMKGKKPNIMTTSATNTVLPTPPENISITIGELANDLSVLDMILDVAKNNSDADCAIGGAILAGQQILNKKGGRILLFASKVPTSGPDLIRVRDVSKIYGTNSEASLLSPNTTYWNLKAQELAKEQVCVDLFLFPFGQFIESSTMFAVCKATNGQMHVYNDFNYTKDKKTLFADVSRHLTRYTGYDSVLRVRCSPGLTVSQYSGYYYKKNETDMDLAGIDADTSMVALLTYDGKLEQSQPAYVQCALLFTDVYGRRLVRVHTLRLEVGVNLDVFKFADTSAVLTALTHEFVHSVVKSKGEFKNARELMLHRCIEILTKYRKSCNDNRSLQLILPESLKNIPIYLLGLSKSPAFRIGTNVPMDTRIAHLLSLITLPAETLMRYCYPDVYCLTNMPEPVNDEAGLTYLPPKVICSSSQLDRKNIYLLDDGYSLHFWIGKNASNEDIEALFGDAQNVNVEDLRYVPNRETELGERVANMIAEICEGRNYHGPIRVYKDGSEHDGYFFSRLIEDRFHSQVSYSEHLFNLHEEINQKLS